MTAGTTRTFRFGGRTVQVRTTASDEDLSRLVDAVRKRATDAGGSEEHGVLLAAIRLEQELEEERANRARLERRMRDALRRVLLRLDAIEEDVSRETPSGVSPIRRG